MGNASHSNKLFGKFQILKKIILKLELKSRYVILTEIPKYNEVMQCKFCKPFTFHLTFSGVCITVSNPSSNHPLLIISSHANTKNNNNNLLLFIYYSDMLTQVNDICSLQRLKGISAYFSGIA